MPMIKIRKRWLLTPSLLLILLVSPLLRGDEIQRGGILMIGLEADFPTFDPLHMGALVERSVAEAFYETLFKLTVNGDLEPFLAQSWQVSEDGKVYTIALRQGVRFHDGTPFNAQAVVSNFQRLLDPANACRCISEISSVEGVHALDSHTVQFTLHEANASLPAVLADVAGMQISPSALQRADFATRPVGTGPFRFVNWNRGVSLKVERNSDYWREGLPYLDGVVYRPIPDSQTRMASLLARDIHISTVPAPEDVDAVRKGRHLNLQVVEAPGLGTVFTMFNTERPPFDDLRVLQALYLGTDRETINKAINRGIYPLANNPFGSGLFGGNIENAFPPYDPDRARALLEDYGKPLRFKLSTTATPTAVRQALVLQQMWKRLGVEVSIEQLEQRQLVIQAVNRGFDAMFFRWSGRADPDLNSYQFFHSASSRNYTRYANPRMDALLEAGRAELDRTKRESIYQQVGELLAQEGPYLFMWSANYFFVVNSSVQNLTPVPGGIPQVDQVWLKRK